MREREREGIRCGKTNVALSLLHFSLSAGLIRQSENRGRKTDRATRMAKVEGFQALSSLPLPTPAPNQHEIRNIFWGFIFSLIFFSNFLIHQIRLWKWLLVPSLISTPKWFCMSTTTEEKSNQKKKKILCFCLFFLTQNGKPFFLFVRRLFYIDMCVLFGAILIDLENFANWFCIL